MPNLKLILVEGQDDQHVVKNILSVRHIVRDDRPNLGDQSLPRCILPKNEREIVPNDDAIYIIDMKGIVPLLDIIEPRIINGRTTHCAIIVDADADVDNRALQLEARWQSLTHHLILSGVPSETIPVQPLQNGTLVRAIQIDRSISVGVWLMPNNQVTGMLEDFLGLLITSPAQQQLWQYVSQTQLNIPQEMRFFTEAHESKAKIHAWLAWQDEPGRPLGQSVTYNYIDSNHPQVDIFVNWLRATLEI